MKEMQIFENQEFGAVRTVELDGEPRRWGTAILTRRLESMLTKRTKKF